MRPDRNDSIYGRGTSHGGEPETQSFAPESRGRGRGGEGDVAPPPGFKALNEFFAPVEEGEGCKDGFCPLPTPKVVQAKPDLVPDLVNHPPHYADSTIECIEAIEAQLTQEEFRGYCKGNIVKYIWRERQKGQTESLKKAQWYLDRLIKFDEA